MGALLGDDVVYVEAGEFAFKPRNQWHTFWNAGDEPCRILEIISPAGFEDFFHELSDMGGVTQVDEQTLAELNARYGLEMRPETVPGLLERFGLRLGEPLAGGWTPPAL
jgi:gentisate 1,2-dioxygenase